MQLSDTSQESVHKLRFLQHWQRGKHCILFPGLELEQYTEIRRAHSETDTAACMGVKMAWRILEYDDVSNRSWVWHQE